MQVIKILNVPFSFLNQSIERRSEIIFAFENHWCALKKGIATTQTRSPEFAQFRSLLKLRSVHVISKT